MRVFRRKASALATLLAVLVVSATCTAAGCLLPAGGSSATSAVMPCCSHPVSPDGPPREDSRHPGRKCCPSCELTIGTQNPDQAGATPWLWAAADFFSAPAFDGLTAPVLNAHVFTGEFVALRPPNTLLRLHCALLN